MKAVVEIAGHELIVEYDFKITSHGCGESYSYHGWSPAEPPEFEIEILGLSFPKRDADVPELEIPKWLNEILNTHLWERDDIIAVVQEADRDPYYGRDPDYERDLRDEDVEQPQ